MATGGEPESVDSRVTCSICLEPYRGRQPKLLPCFHTFCLPCLTQLVDSAALQKANQAASSNSADPVTITCPTCRTPRPLPPGGAAALQTNFYIHDDSSGNALPSTATSNSTTPAVAVTSQKINELQSKAKEQVKVLAAVTSQLSNDVKEIDRQRETVEQEIHTRYTEGLRLLAEARDRSLVSLNQAAELATDELLAETSTLQFTLASLQQFAGENSATLHASASSGKKLEELLVSNAAIRHFKQRPSKKKQSSVFCYSKNTKEEMSTTADDFDGFMGKVSLAGDPVNQVSGSDDQSEQQGASLAKLTSDINILQRDVTRFGTVMSSLEKDAESTRAELASLRTDLTRSDTAKGRLEKESADVQADLMSLQKKHGQSSSRFQSQIASVEQSVTGLKTAQGNLDVLTSTLKTQIGKLSRPVFFNVRLLGDQTVYGSCTLTFNELLSNEGGGYNAGSGHFIAPLSGTYIFMFTARPTNLLQCIEKGTEVARFHIVLEGGSVATAYCKGLTTATAHVVLQVKSGQKVQVNTDDILDRHKFRGDGFTTFSGALIQAEL